VADNVLAGIIHQNVGELRKAIIVFRLVRVGGIGVQRIRMNRLEGCHEFRVGIQKIIDLAEIAAFDKCTEPLRVGNDEVVLLLTRGERCVDAGVEIRPWNEVNFKLYSVAALRLVLLVEELLHDAGWRPIRHGHCQRHVLGGGKRCASNRHKGGKAKRRGDPFHLRHCSHLRFSPIVTRFASVLRCQVIACPLAARKM